MDIRAIIMGLAFALMWSSAFTSARIIVADAPPISVLAIRFAISGTIAIIIAWALGQSWRLSKAEWRATLIFGICQNAAYLGLNFVAMQTIEASIAAIIASTMPLLVALAGWLVFKERIPWLGVAGLVAGIAGVVMIMGTRVGAGADWTGIAFCVAGVLALTIATLAVRNVASGRNVLMMIGFHMWIGSAVLSVVALGTETWSVNYSLSWAAAFVYTILVPGLAATWVWFLLVGRIGAVKAATFHFLNPFLGVAIAAAILGEQLALSDIVGVAVIAAGIYAVQRAKLVQTKGTGLKSN